MSCGLQHTVFAAIRARCTRQPGSAARIATKRGRHVNRGQARGSLRAAKAHLVLAATALFSGLALIALASDASSSSSANAARWRISGGTMIKATSLRQSTPGDSSKGIGLMKGLELQLEEEAVLSATQQQPAWQRQHARMLIEQGYAPRRDR